MTSTTDTAFSPEQSKAGRALVAWSQQDLATAAGVGTSTVADFERGARTLMANNAQAIRQALEAKGLRFLAGGVVERNRLPAPPPSLRPGALMRWVNSTHLSQWGEQRDAQSSMPELVSRLIYASVGPAARLRFPSDESVQLPGWDGVCSNDLGAKYVPAGQSVWEIGCQRNDVRAKADKDFVKRSAQSSGVEQRETTFVFVTPQRFTGKDAWALEKKALGVWRDVVAIDADDLVHWLENYPAVAHWLAVKIRRRPDGLRNLEEMWEEWIRATSTRLTSDVVLTGRDGDQVAVLKWLEEPPAQLSIRAESPDEAIAFLYAAISYLPPAYRFSYWSRCVIAENAETARQLVGLGTPLIIVMTDPDAGLAQRLVDDGHQVYAAYGPTLSDVAGVRGLSKPWRFDLQLALVQAGVKEEDAHQLAQASGRSITVLRRLMPSAPSAQESWAVRASPELIAAMFAGGWFGTNQQDRQIVSELAGRPYEDVEAVLAPLVTLGGPLVRMQEAWKVVSLRDLWTQIAPQITPAQLARFESAFERVLGAVNPRFETRPKSIYYEQPGEFAEEPSTLLRGGLSEAMIALGVFPERASAVSDAHHRSERAVSKLLTSAKPGLWWSLARDFKHLAEAAPQAFLEAVEESLRAPDQPIRALFRTDEGMFHPTEYLAGLLWALEILARSPKFLQRAALLLAKLNEIDPGGKWLNRPSASLRRIFVSWSPQTYASPGDRLKVIERIAKSFPATGWDLIVGLAPKSHDMTEPSAMPAWRDFAPDSPEEITWISVGNAAKAIGNLLLSQAGRDVEHWKIIIGLWPNFDAPWRDEASRGLLAYAQGDRTAAEIEQLREKIRSTLSSHRDFSDAEWAMPEEDLRPLDEAFNALQPVGIEDQVRWLFKPGAQTMRLHSSWQQQQAALEEEQSQAAAQLLKSLATDQLFSFAHTVSFQRELGVAIATAAARDQVTTEMMRQGLRSEDTHKAEVGLGILFGLLKNEADRDGWIQALWDQAIAERWGDQAERRIALCLVPTEPVWAKIDGRPNVTSAYWQRLPIYAVPRDANQRYIVDHLLRVDRSRDAVGWLGYNLSTNPDPVLVVEVLKAAGECRQPLEGNDATMFTHYVGTLLDYLETQSKDLEVSVVELEWFYFELLRYTPRKAKALHRALASDPELFVALIKLVYMPSKESGIEEPQPDDIEKARGRISQAFSVLHDWSRVPGSDEHGVIDGAALEDWVKRARKALSECGRGEIGDSKIGEILSAARRTPDEPWPPEPVREVIELVRSKLLEQGFELGVHNRRGVTVRMPRDGGAQERVLADAYLRDSSKLNLDWPRTAACLERIAAHFQDAAKQEDDRAERSEWR